MKKAKNQVRKFMYFSIEILNSIVEEFTLNKLNSVWLFVKALHLFKLLLIIRNNYVARQKTTKLT